MALVNRITKLFKADMHAVIDQLEEPYSLLKQSIRDMETLLEDNERVLNQLQKSHQEIEQKLSQFVSVKENIQEQLDICFEAENDGLARVLIKRLLEQQQFENVLIAKRKVIGEEISELQAIISQRQPLLDSMRQKAEIFASERVNSESEMPLSEQSVSVSREDIEIALLKEKQKRGRS